MTPIHLLCIDNFIAHYNRVNGGHFFDKDTLKFFGETRSNMRLCKGTFEIADTCGEVHTCYKITTLQRNYPGGSRRVAKYFDVETMDDVIL